jgi:signal transduction histidine kinase
MKFADILASLIHDMKNSLGMVINTLEEFSGDALTGGAAQHKLSALQQEAKRLNNNLIELLTLYKIENERISANIEEWNVSDFLEEIIAENRASAASRGVRLEAECNADLSGYFDEGLLRGVINSLIGNGLRYTRTRLLLTAGQEEGYLVFKVADDGDGFPEKMLQAQRARSNGQCPGEGRTQLGIYFADMVAALHRSHDKSGFIRIANNCLLEGGCFSIWLP